MQFNVKAPTWVLGTVATGIIIGGVVAMMFFTGKLSPEQTKTAIGIGFCFWLLAAICCWATSVKIEAVTDPNHDHKPNLSSAEFKRFQDRERGWY